jgi:transposase
VNQVAKQYDKDFKIHAVQLVLEQGKPAAQVARELGITPKTLYGWISQYKSDPTTPFVGSGNLKPDAKAVRDLEREIRELREENAILKKALRIFSNDRK